MKITKLETFHVLPRWLFLKISTDEGICGWGEPVLEGRSTVVEEAVHVLGKMIVGEDPRNIEHLWQIMYRGSFYRGGAIICSAISGIEQALWDIKGKALGVPVWQLLGGKCRDRIRMYAHITPNVENPTIEEVCDWAKKRVNDGFKSLKTPMFAPVRHIDTMATVEKYVEKFAAIRETVGKDIDIAIDFHGRISPAMAPIMCRELEQFYPMFIEEPVLPENIDAMVTVARSTTIPIATGERLFTTWGFREVIEKQAAVVLQPDVSHCGGILQAYKIAAMGANYYCSMAPHNPLGPIALASCLQLDTCIPNFTAQEHPTTPNGHDLGKELFVEAFEIKDGYIDVPMKPGLGFEVNEAAVKEYSYDGYYTCPMEFHKDDNSLGDW
ncbi:MAG: galactonate dehydratase [Clostridiales bacterium]|jgi:galactonate dehydratase|nr:galactonate dehydratase [Clostridiales bacterium]